MAKKNNNITLIGMPASGKSTIGWGASCMAADSAR